MNIWYKTDYKNGIFASEITEKGWKSEYCWIHTKEKYFVMFLIKIDDLFFCLLSSKEAHKVTY